jgi:signal transduction histidine kinase
MNPRASGPNAGTTLAYDQVLEVIPADVLREPSLQDVFRGVRDAMPRIKPAWAMAAVSLVCAAWIFGILVAIWLRHGWVSDIAQFLVWGPLFVIYTAVGLLILSRSPGHRVGWTLCAAGTAWLVAQALYTYGLWGLEHAPGSLPWAAEVTQAGGFYPFGLYIVLVELLLIFPTGRLSSPRWRIVRWLGIAGALGATFGVTLGFPLVMNGEMGEIANPFYVSHPSWLATVFEVSGVGFFLMFVMSVPAAVSMVRRLRRASGTERIQLQWVAWGTVILLVGYTFHIVVAIGNGYQSIWAPFSAIVWGLAINSFAVVIGIAILRHHLFDIHVIISRTLVYSLLTLGVVGIYLVLVLVFDSLVVTMVRDRSERVVLSLVLTAGIALLVQPMRDRLQVVANRLVYGERDRPDVVLTRLGGQLEASAAPEVILPRMTGMIVETLKLPHAAVALGEGASARIAAEAGVPGEVQVSFPMQYQGERIGELRVTPRTPGEGFSSEDRRLLSDIARQAAVAAYAVGVTSDLRRAREVLVNAREEERRRLRRDLHDGLGAQLAALVMQVGIARKVMARDAVTADRMLDELQDEMRGAIADIRRLIHGLRPPALDEFGLVSALRSRLLAFQHGPEEGLSIRLVAPEPFPALTAATEVAIFRIVEEAVTNVVKHARASTVTITLDCEDGVRLRIEDDGVGIREDRGHGVGLHSMRERTEELGGRLEVRSGGEGTQVEASFPAAREEQVP